MTGWGRRNCSSRGAPAACACRAACSPTWTAWSGRRARAVRRCPTAAIKATRTARGLPPARRAPGPENGTQRGRDRAAGQQATLFESALTTLISRPFGWLVVAEPTARLDAETADLRTQLNVLRRYDEEHARFDADRAQRRLAELDAFREAGLWNVRVLAGAATEDELRLIAPVLVGSIDLGAHPYRLRSVAGARDLADALVTKHLDASDGAEVPFAATAGALVALTGLPRLEVPGVRVLQPGYFDLTSETGQTAGEQAIELGTILDVADRPVGAFRVPLDTLNRHAFVTGATGAGKSQTVRHLLEQLTGAGIPWLAIEPVKSEYAAMAGRIGDGGQVMVINPADPAAVPLSVNPLAPEPGYPVQAHIDMVRALFLAAFDAHEPFPQIISQALQRAYEACGWDPVTGGGRPDAPAPPRCPPWPGCSRRRWRSSTTSATAGSCRPTSAASWMCGCGRCGSARRAGSSRAATRQTSASCSGTMWCWRSRTSPTTRTRPSSSAR